MDYRKLYVEEIGKIPKGFDVHHIDHNKKNNKTINLVALPSNIHRRYHSFYTQVKKYDPQRMIQNKKQFLMQLETFDELYRKVIWFANMKFCIVGEESEG